MSTSSFWINLRNITTWALRIQKQEPSILTWKLDKTSIHESSPKKDIFSALSSKKELSFLEVLEGLRMATDDKNVKGLVIDLSTAGSSSFLQPSGGKPNLAQVQELREAITQFGEAKKAQFGKGQYKLVACSDTFDSQLMYYLATAFDEIHMEPVGYVDLHGLGGTMMFARNLMDRIGIKIQDVSAGEYKGATSFLTHTKYPPEQLENMTAIFRDLHSQLRQGIAEGRGGKLKPIAAAGKTGTTAPPSGESIVQGAMDVAPLWKSTAIDHGFVDALTYVRTLIPILPPSPKPKPWDPARRAYLPFTTYVAEQAKKKKKELKKLKNGKDKVTIGVVYLSGAMRMGDGGFESNAVAKAIVEAARDKDVGAIVFRVDTPGGHATAAETIWEAVEYAQKECKKPVIASYGDISASGGYYCTANCAKILSHASTITGSIGVALARPIVTPRFLDALGITTDSILNSEASKFWSPFHELDEKGMERFKAFSEAVYETFKEKVVKGRGMSPQKVQDLARGRLYTGEEAVKLGLVDEIGGIQRALQVAADYVSTIDTAVNAQIEPRVFPRPKPFWQRLREAQSLSDLMGGIRSVDVSSIAQTMLGSWSFGDGSRGISVRMEGGYQKLV